jgi:acetolactate synthase I/II/III large subunit
VLPDDAIVTCDAGENRILMTHIYQNRSANGFLQAAGAGPMGFGIPAALAAKLVFPERVVVAICGDGGFAMTMNGLMTAVEQNIPIVNVVFNKDQLEPALREAIACGRPAVIDVVTSLDVSFRDVTSPLAR